MKSVIPVLLTVLLLAGCTATSEMTGESREEQVNPETTMTVEEDTTNTSEENASTENVSYETATLAGGCFWCIEAQYDGRDDVKEAISGYAGGSKENATYEAVSTGNTEHREAVQVTYNPDVLSYEDILDRFWRSIDPTDAGGQFADRGPQYTTAIYYHDDEQRRVAQRMKDELSNSSKFDEPIVTEIAPYTTFFKAEDRHQNYSEKRTSAYKRYEEASGRKDYVEETWAEPADDIEAAKENLSTIEQYVTQQNGTEPPYANEYYNHDESGIYVDVVSGEPLFSSTHKYDSGTGWPSFYKPLEPDNIVKRNDTSLLSTRVEVRSKHGDSHLGHVFDDGPEPTGKRYCINSAALEFIPADELEAKGYGEYTNLFN